MTHLVIFGLGHSARAFCERVRNRFDTVKGTVRSLEKAAYLSETLTPTCVFDGQNYDEKLLAHLHKASACLISIPPNALGGDPVLTTFADHLSKAPNLKWIGYLSTVGVYGDHQGAWVDEDTPCRPVSARSVARDNVEKQWLHFGESTGKTIQIFRLSGIYGPGKNALVNLQNGTARRIIKPDQVFNRIHVEDIAGTVEAGQNHASLSGIFNVTDDEPAPPQDVVTYAATLLGLPIPPDIPFENAPLSEMGRSFYGENKRVSNAKLISQLGYSLAYPTYREGLNALLKSET
jgi:nucleoside-diphosphate-sugar epimerase